MPHAMAQYHSAINGWWMNQYLPYVLENASNNLMSEYLAIERNQICYAHD